MFLHIATVIYRNKWPIFFLMVLLTLAFGQAMTKIQIDPSMDPLFDKNSHEYKYYSEYNKKYGSDQMIAVAMATPDLFRIHTLRELRFLTTEIPKLGPVERILSLANAMDVKSKVFGVKTVPVLRGVFEGKRSPEEVRKDVLSNELFLGNLVSKDGRIANLLVYLKPSGQDRHQSGAFIKNLREFLDSREGQGVRFYVAGSPVEQYDFIKLIRRDQFIFVPLIAILLSLTTLFIYRSWTCMFLAMSIVLMTLVWTMGTISLLGSQLNLMTSLLAPVIMIVSVINAVYLMNAFFEVREKESSLIKAVGITIQTLGVPCFLTHFVAILGFLSLGVSAVPAMKGFGVYAALGTFYSYLVEVVLTPIFFSTLPYRPLEPQHHPRRRLIRRALIFFIEKLDVRWKWWIVVLTFVTIFFSIEGISRLHVDTNLVKQMKPELPLAISTRFIDNNLTGVYSLGFVLRRRDGGSFVDYDTLERVEKFKKYLEAKPEISKVNSITTVIKKINQANLDNAADSYRIPRDPDLLRRYFEGVRDSKDPEAMKILSPDFREIRMEARMRAVGTTEGANVEATTRLFLDQNMGRFFDYELTGNVVLLGRMAKGLVHEQLHSFGFAFGSILVVIILMFRSVRLGLLAAVPNLIPIIAVYGIMGYVPIELSTPTAMISSIVLGLVVDASIQFLYRFRQEFHKRGHYLQALHHTYRNMGQSMIVSTMILVAGFASSVFASFRPTIHFGVLTSLTIFLALICTLVVVPVGIIIFKPFGPQRLFARKSYHRRH